MQSTSVYDTYKMNKVKELKIDRTLWATPARLVNLLDFKPEKLSIETKSSSNKWGYLGRFGSKFPNF